jgi:hypothetical protein
MPRTVLPLDAKLLQQKCSDGRIRTYYLDSGYTAKELETRFHDFDAFRGALNKIAQAFGKKGPFLQIVVTNPRTDARYLMERGDMQNTCIIVNLLRYEKNKSNYFWLISISREIAYIFAKRLGYHHQNVMREMLMSGLARFTV